MATHSSILAWRIHGQRSLTGYSRGSKEPDMTKATEHAYVYTCVCIYISKDLGHHLFTSVTVKDTDSEN